MADSEAVLTAIRQEGMLSITFGLIMLAAAVAIGVVLRNTMKVVARDATAKKLSRSRQALTLRRMGRAAALFALMMVAIVFAAWHLLDSKAWLAANDPYAALVLHSGEN